MKHAIVLAAVLLAACSKSPEAAQAAPVERPLPAGGETLYRVYLDEGHSPAEAKQMVIDQAGPSDLDRTRAANRAAQRADEIAQVRKSACKADLSC